MASLTSLYAYSDRNKVSATRNAGSATPANSLLNVNARGSNANSGIVAQNSSANGQSAAVGLTNSGASNARDGGAASVASNAGLSNVPTPATSPVAGQTSPVQAANAAAAETAPAATPAATPVTPVGTSYSFTRSTETGTAPNTYTPTGMYEQANLDKYNADREQKIRDLYAAAQQNTLNGLKTAYDQNISDANAALDKISPQYQERMNALSSEYERQRRNNNMQAASNGLNTGAGSQMALAQSAAYQANQGKLARSEQEAINDANRRILDLQNTYQNAIAEATANNNYKLAAAMLDEYQNAYNRQMNLENTNYQRQWNEDERAYTRSGNEASLKAQYGDFSGFKDLYGDEIGGLMEQTWALQNPQVAWASGKISAEDYQKLTGYAPYGATGTGAAGAGTTDANGNYTDEYGITYLPNGNIVYNGKEYGTAGKKREQISDYDLNLNLVIDNAKRKSAKGAIRVRRSYGRGYSASKDKAYRGAPGYLNENGQFVTGWSDDAPAPGHEGDYGVAHAYAAAYEESQSPYLSNLYAQDTHEDYEPTKTWTERAAGK